MSKKQIKNQLCDLIGNQIHDQIHKKVWVQVWNKVYLRPRGHSWNSIRIQIYNNTLRKFRNE